MDNKKEQERQMREEQAIVEHARLAKLFENDRMAFERERKQIINDTIKQCGNTQRQKQLRLLQKKIDTTMQTAGSQHNRLVLMQMLFWNQVHNVFLPALQMFGQVKLIWDSEKESISKPQIKLCKKT